MTFAGAKFCEAVCKRASKEGWKLHINPLHYIWKKDKKMFQNSSPIGMHPAYVLHIACVAIDERFDWKTSVEM